MNVRAEAEAEVERPDDDEREQRRGQEARNSDTARRERLERLLVEDGSTEEGRHYRRGGKERARAGTQVIECSGLIRDRPHGDVVCDPVHAVGQGFESRLASR